MLRQLARMFFATFVVSITMAVTLAAQGRGGGHHGAVGGRIAPGPGFARGPAFVGRAPTPVVTPPLVGRAPGSLIAPRIVGGPRVVVRHQPRIIFPQPFIGAYSPFFWNSLPVYTPPVYVAPTYDAPSVSQNEADLAQEVQRLSREIEQLRYEQSRTAPAYSPPAAPERPAIPTVLVFRDGHRMEIQNYAIVGQTVWIFDENTSTRIALSELDLEATQRENRSRGVRFPTFQK